MYFFFYFNPNQENDLFECFDLFFCILKIIYNSFKIQFYVLIFILNFCKIYQTEFRTFRKNNQYQ